MATTGEAGRVDATIMIAPKSRYQQILGSSLVQWSPGIRLFVFSFFFSPFFQFFTLVFLICFFFIFFFCFFSLSLSLRCFASKKSTSFGNLGNVLRCAHHIYVYIYIYTCMWWEKHTPVPHHQVFLAFFLLFSPRGMDPDPQQPRGAERGAGEVGGFGEFGVGVAKGAGALREGADARRGRGL